jgi:hypothetical protein
MYCSTVFSRETVPVYINLLYLENIVVHTVRGAWRIFFSPDDSYSYRNVINPVAKRLYSRNIPAMLTEFKKFPYPFGNATVLFP